jgi:hypothetical protein
MIVAIYGSYPNDDWKPLADIEAFKLTCREIGRYFAKCRFGIVVTSEKETTADYYVVRGFIEVWKERVERNDVPKEGERCLLVFAQRTSAAFDRHIEENPSLFRCRTSVEKTRFNRHLVGLEECDLVVVVGGNDHTSNAASVAQSVRRIPVLPVGKFGGAARKFLLQMWEKDPALNPLISANHKNISQILAKLIETIEQPKLIETIEQPKLIETIEQPKLIETIEQHYPEKLEKYKQEFLEIVRLANPLSESSRMKLEDLKKVLGLKNEDVTLVESLVISDIENGNKSDTPIAPHGITYITYNLYGTIVGNFAHNDQSNQSNSQNHWEIVMETPKFDFRGATVGSFAETVHGDQKSIQHIYAPEQKQTLTEAAFEIQRLIKQLEMTNPNATEAEQAAYVNNQTTPKLKQRVVAALQAGSEAAIEEFLDNPYVNVGKAVVKSWIKPG